MTSDAMWKISRSLIPSRSIEDLIQRLYRVMEFFQEDPRRWIQNQNGDQYYDKETGQYRQSHCLGGAMQKFGLPNIALWCDLAYEEDCTGIVDFNDRPGRTREDIILFVKKAILRLESKLEGAE